MSMIAENITVGTRKDMGMLASFLNSTFSKKSFVYKQCDQLIQNMSFELNQLKGLNRVGLSSVRLSNAFELMVVALHCAILDMEFSCVSDQNPHEESSNSRNAILAESLLPANWNKCHPSVITITYEHSQYPNRTYKLEVSTDGKQALVQFSHQDDLSQHTADAVTSLTIEDYVDSFAGVEPLVACDEGVKSGAANMTVGQVAERLRGCFINYEGLVERITSLVQQSGNATTAATTTSGSQPSAPPMQQQGEEYSLFSGTTGDDSLPDTLKRVVPDSQVPMSTFDDPPLAPQYSAFNMPSEAEVCIPQSMRGPRTEVGRGDLHPQIDHQLLHLMTPQSGSEVGPDHPMFIDDPPSATNLLTQQRDPDFADYFFPSTPPGAGGIASAVPPLMPQARFDPYGPVVGPSSLGVDVGDVGVDWRGRRTSPGDKNRWGDERGPTPGEPNPDHLRPPGF